MPHSLPLHDPAPAAAALRTRLDATLGEVPAVAVVLGSGIKALDDLQGGGSVSYAELPGFPAATVAGHAGILSWGRMGSNGPAIFVARGRFHLYEGHGLPEALTLVELFHALGVADLVLTNAAGGLRADWQPGDLMLVDDHINMQGVQAGFPPPAAGPLCPEWTGWRPVEVYDGGWRQRLAASALMQGIPLRSGIYVGLLGPSYETMAENRYLLYAGVDAVGMSTVPEAARARARGMAVVAISCITNISITPQGASETSHHEVVDVAKAASANMEALLRAAVGSAPGLRH
ncbi:MAG: purine-nucleoside phosphorylase [Candidatus Sericytochromatia bacterium]|nr:purine-nucleoside phosphorylase [Candidatus Sericytochromatia bacterium]